MVFRYKILLFLVIVLTSCSSRKAGPVVPVVENGVSRSLALYRKAVLTAIHYTLELDIPAEKNKGIAAHEILNFKLSSVRTPLQLDFKEDPAKISLLTINGKTAPVTHSKEHLILLPEFLKKGDNEVRILFRAGDGALNRNTDYLYTLFVPDRARTVFPCFDQPDLKATYTLTLHLPKDWKAIANAELKDTVQKQERKTYHYKTSDLLSTYLFAFAAGKFQLDKGIVNTQRASFLYRETDAAKIKPSLPAIYAIHSAALKYLEDWTGIPYPFQKFGFVAIPDFQFGGMEHPGAIQYKAASLFLDAGATKDQLNARNNLISHETAHMWFGDLVTMDWFSDVWMKEVFANFMADKSAEEADGKDNYALKFLIDHFPAAYAVDRTAGANPIRQPLDNLKDAGTLYGNIIYHKAPIMMQQLEKLMGKDKFQQGVREYLKKFANSNASWPDLIRILDSHTPVDLEKWNKVWVNENGRPVIDYKIIYQGDKISSLIITQQAELGAQRVWPQSFEVTLFYPDRVKVISADLVTAQLELKEAAGLDKPLFILFNSAGDGYGEWPVDPAVQQYLFGLEKPLHRAVAYISLYEQMLSGKNIQPAALLTLFSQGLAKEGEELNVRLLSNYISTIYWQFSAVKERQLLSAALENKLWDAMLQQKSSNNKKQLFKAYQDIFLSPAARNKLYQIWKSQKAPPGITLSEDDYTSLALSLAVRDDADIAILPIQESRITNPDRKKRFEFIMPAVSAKQGVRDDFFDSLRFPANRAKESNVLAALYYLHHPLRQQHSVVYLEKSLELLAEIQATGDIFFPQSWLQATFGYYQSAAAAGIVRDFLKNHPDYNPRLKAKILQATDNLARAARLSSQRSK
ncbi:M1 family metallopeptidase [Pedobacter cryoconitis]|uniref:Aminopeptidase N n=1 Tax=Pedobacter cryoconitis TaxID=188932 RepID=A0A327T3N4_9SPHI|nr:M1 family aminopeptidase [Pedobacter cryoconitis]RAJ35482.1 aminopeptidase N [Pedobacter cryoconitis]